MRGGERVDDGFLARELGLLELRAIRLEEDGYSEMEEPDFFFCRWLNFEFRVALVRGSGDSWLRSVGDERI